MEAYEKLLQWAQGKGVELNGIRPERIANRGVGIVTTRKVEQDEIILQVPARCLRTLDTVPKTVSRKLPRDMTVHGLLAADLAMDQTSKYSAWNALIPSMSDLQTLPLVWAPQLQALLPFQAASLLSKQQAKFTRDWTAASASLPTLTHSDYLYAWLLVNTRTFYHDTPRTERLPCEDRMALQPVADLFNHADSGCAVSYDQDGFAITAARGHAAGEELCICYGKHGNDFLLLEYGFVLATNRWDEVRLDSVIEARLTPRQRAALEEAGFLENYVLDGQTVCYRTEVALRIMCLPLKEWRRFVAAEDDGTRSEGKMEELLREVLETYRSEVKDTLVQVDVLRCGEPCQRELLKARWLQILHLVESAIQRFVT